MYNASQYEKQHVLNVFIQYIYIYIYIYIPYIEVLFCFQLILWHDQVHSTIHLRDLTIHSCNHSLFLFI